MCFFGDYSGWRRCCRDDGAVFGAWGVRKHSPPSERGVPPAGRRLQECTFGVDGKGGGGSTAGGRRGKLAKGPSAKGGVSCRPPCALRSRDSSGGSLWSTAWAHLRFVHGADQIHACIFPREAHGGARRPRRAVLAGFPDLLPPSTPARRGRLAPPGALPSNQGAPNVEAEGRRGHKLEMRPNRLPAAKNNRRGGEDGVPCSRLRRVPLRQA